MTVFEAAVLTVSEKKMETTMLLWYPDQASRPPTLIIEAAGQGGYKHTIQSLIVYSCGRRYPRRKRLPHGRNRAADPNGSIQSYTTYMPTAPLRLNVLMLKAEVIGDRDPA